MPARSTGRLSILEYALGVNREGKLFVLPTKVVWSSIRRVEDLRELEGFTVIVVDIAFDPVVLSKDRAEEYVVKDYEVLRDVEAYEQRLPMLIRRVEVEGNKYTFWTKKTRQMVLENLNKLKKELTEKLKLRFIRAQIP